MPYYRRFHTLCTFNICVETEYAYLESMIYETLRQLPEFLISLANKTVLADILKACSTEYLLLDIVNVVVVEISLAFNRVDHFT